MFANMAGITHLEDACSAESYATYIITKNTVLTCIYKMYTETTLPNSLLGQPKRISLIFTVYLHFWLSSSTGFL